MVLIEFVLAELEKALDCWQVYFLKPSKPETGVTGNETGNETKQVMKTGNENNDFYQVALLCL